MVHELDKLDQALLDKNRKCMLMLIFDHDDLWKVTKPSGLKALKYNKMLKDKNLDHKLYLLKKINNYLTYIENGGILQSFPNCTDSDTYTYEIRVVTNTMPNPDFFEFIKDMNNHISKQLSFIVITHEILPEKD